MIIPFIKMRSIVCMLMVILIMMVVNDNDNNTAADDDNDNTNHDDEDITNSIDNTSCYYYLNYMAVTPLFNVKLFKCFVNHFTYIVKLIHTCLFIELLYNFEF